MDDWRIAEETFKYKGKKYWISTVKLGIDHGFDGTPKWYETMIFAKNFDDTVNYSDLYCNRYTTEEQALQGHKDTLKAIWDGVIKL